MKSMTSREEPAETSGEADLEPEVSPEPAGAAQEEQDFVSEHITEVEVFLKYGLMEKALEQLEMILEKYPKSLEVLQKIKDLHLEKGEPGV